jgi:antagonist of mitotic exit network protein 1
MKSNNEIPVNKPNSNNYIKQSPASTSLLSRTRKISTELPRPLKRTTSLTYRVFTPNQMMMPSLSSKTDLPNLNRSQSIKKNFRRRFRSLRRSSSTKLITASSQSLITSSSSQLSSPIQGFSNEKLSVNSFLSPPSSPINFENDHENGAETESDEGDTSIFSHSSDSLTRDTSFNFDFPSFTTPNSSSCETSPLYKKNNIKFKPILNDFLNSNIFLNEFNENDDISFYNNNGDNDLLTLQTIQSSTRSSLEKCHKIFKIPEILEIILRYVANDYTDQIPTEPKMNRRPPLSYNHSILMYGETNGKKIWNRTVSNSSTVSSINPTPSLNNNYIYNNKNKIKRNPNLYNCLLVNKNWNFTILQILNENLYFETDYQLENFTSTLFTKSNNNSILPEPFSFVLHKLKPTQSIIDLASTQISPRRLNWIEFYICPTILPPIEFITNSLKKLVLPGCRNLNDDYMKKIIIKAPNLTYLDIRACDLITDASLYFIGENCSKLELFNCGRHKRGELITDISIGLIVKNCPIKTLGVAGCGISDWTIWEIALNLGTNIERLSLNNCWKLTEIGICRVLKAKLLENLSVLEIRNINLKDIKDIVYWKRDRLKQGHKVLIEGCENIDLLIKNFENKLNLKFSNELLENLNQWLQEENDNDNLAYIQFLNERRGTNRIV